jgi:hypothetical protein
VWGGSEDWSPVSTAAFAGSLAAAHGGRPMMGTPTMHHGLVSTPAALVAAAAKLLEAVDVASASDGMSDGGSVTGEAAPTTTILNWLVEQLSDILPIWFAMLLVAAAACELRSKVAPKDGRPWAAIGVPR